MEFFRALPIVFTLPLILTALDVTFRSLPTSCQEAVQPWLKIKATQPNYPIDGVYLIETPNSGLEPYQVYCERDPNGGPHWTVIQRRIDGSLNFFRNFTEYENGFGSLNHEFWMGLKKIHALTDAEKTELWIKIVDDKKVAYNYFYEKFFVGIGDKYILYVEKQLGNNNDVLEHNNGMAFSTYDRDLDEWSANCAREGGGWWHGNCSAGYLNGPYKQCYYLSTVLGYYNGLCFDISNNAKIDKRNIKYVHLAIRPVEKA